VSYADGGVRTYNFERMRDLSYVEKYQRERYRKLLENMQGAGTPRMWPYLARYAAIHLGRPFDRRAYPISVNLIRYSSTVAPPGAKPHPYIPFRFFSERFLEPPDGWPSGEQR
jgi:hypothetical protein